MYHPVVSSNNWNPQIMACHKFSCGDDHGLLWHIISMKTNNYSTLAMKTSPNLRWNYMILLNYIYLPTAMEHVISLLNTYVVYFQMISNKILMKFLAQLHTMEHDPRICPNHRRVIFKLMNHRIALEFKISCMLTLTWLAETIVYVCWGHCW